jgi:hypothetical protein
VQLDEGAKSATKTVTVVNEGDASTTVTFSVIADSGEVTVLTDPPAATKTLDATSVTAVSLTFTVSTTEADVSGRLVMQSPDAVLPAAVDLEILIPRNTTAAPQAVVVASLAVAALLVLLRAGSLKWGAGAVSGFHLKERLGPVAWKFTDSWASNLTAVGAILGTLVSAELLPERRVYVSEDWLKALNVFFGVLLVVAPFVYSSMRVPTKPYPEGDKEPEYKGLVVGFLLACGITLWAVVGELMTTALFVLEARGKLGLDTILIPGLILAGSLLLAMAYAWNTMRWTIEAQISPEGRSKRRRKKRQRAAEVMRAMIEPVPATVDDLSDEEAQVVDRELRPSWSLL